VFILQLLTDEEGWGALELAQDGHVLVAPPIVKGAFVVGGDFECASQKGFGAGVWGELEEGGSVIIPLEPFDGQADGRGESFEGFQVVGEEARELGVGPRGGG
jgi:hypothetical protein